MCPGEMSGASVEVDFRVGGQFRIVMHGEQDFEQTGQYLEIEPNKRLVFSWISHWMPPEEAHTRVSVTLEPEGDGDTRLTLVHDQLPETGSYDGHRDGWSTILDKLETRLG